MSLPLSKVEKRFLGRLVLANGIAWPVGLVAAIILSAIIGFLLMVMGKIGLLPEIIPKENNLLVGLCMGSAVGYAQWFVIKKHYKISVWWIFASTIGLGIPFILEFLLGDLIIINIASSDMLGQGIVYFVGGLLAGLLQYRIFRFHKIKFMWWIIISPFAWGISVLGFYILSGIIQGLITGMVFLRIFKLRPLTEELKKVNRRAVVTP